MVSLQTQGIKTAENNDTEHKAAARVEKLIASHYCTQETEEQKVGNAAESYSRL